MGSLIIAKFPQLINNNEPICAIDFVIFTQLLALTLDSITEGFKIT